MQSLHFLSVQLFTVTPLYYLDLDCALSTVKIPYACHYKLQLVFFTPFFTAVYKQERIMLQTIYGFKEIHQ